MHYKFLKKIIGALGYKIIDKNLIKNERLLSKYSFLTMDKILDNLFSNYKVKFVIQIGSNDGKRFDNLNKFIEIYNPTSIFVEPIKSIFMELKKNYPEKKNLIFENLAISVKNEISNLYKVKESKTHLYDNHILGITSFDRNHLIKHGVKNNHIELETVETISIMDLLKKHHVNNFDLLLIDTEGYDANIVLDFLENSKIRPIIIFEYIHTENRIFQKAIKLLEEKKYFFFKVEENIFCYPNEIQHKLKII